MPEDAVYLNRRWQHSVLPCHMTILCKTLCKNGMRGVQLACERLNMMFLGSAVYV